MLSSKYRFHSRGGVRFVYGHGKTIRTTNFALVYVLNTRKKQRFAVVVSKKILKSAVGRNRIRRRVYEAIRLELSKYQVPMDFIFIIHSKTVATIPFMELRRNIQELLERSISQTKL